MRSSRAIAAGGLVLAPIAVAMVVAATGSEERCDGRFDRERWLAASARVANEPVDDSGAMSADEATARRQARRAVGCGLVIGRSRAEVRRLLGDERPRSARELHFRVGAEEVDPHSGPAEASLLIEMDGDRAVYADAPGASRGGEHLTAGSADH